jgi:hypothetical protein
MASFAINGEWQVMADQEIAPSAIPACTAAMEDALGQCKLAPQVVFDGQLKYMASSQG